MNSLKKESIINTVLIYLGIAIGFINKGLLFPFLLNVDQVGLINVVVLFSNYFAQFVNLGTGIMVVRFVPFFNQHKKGEISVLMFALFILSISIVFFSSLTFVFSSSLENLIKEKSSLLGNYSFWIVPIGIAGAFFSLFEQYLRTIAKTTIGSFYQEFVLKISTLILLVFYHFNTLSFPFFVNIFFLIHVIPSLGLLLYLLKSKQLVIKSQFKIKKKMKKMMMNYSFIVYFNLLGRNLIIMADVLILTYIGGLAEVGVFTMMMFITNALVVPYIAILKVSSPVVPRLIREKKTVELGRLYSKVSSIGYFFVIISFAIVWINFDFIMKFFPAEYLRGKYIFLFLMFGKICDVLGGLNGDIILNSKKFKSDIVLMIVILVIVYSMNYLLIPEYLGIGAALSTAIVYFIYNLIRFILVYNFFKIHPFTINLSKMIFSSILLFSTSLILSHYLANGLLILLITFAMVTVFIVLTLKWRLEPELNNMIEGGLKKIGLK